MLVTSAVRELRRENPDADVQAMHLDWDQARNALLGHRVDAVVTRLPFPTDHLHVTVLYDEPRVLAVPIDHRLAAGNQSPSTTSPTNRCPGCGTPFELIASGQAVAITAGFHGNSLRPDITTVPLENVEPSHVVLATRAGDRSRLVVAFRKLAEAHLTAPARA
jgi:DNA-binding transcriptional LysR family regulator